MPKADKTPNDRRSEVKNPTSEEYQKDYANREKLGHPLPEQPPLKDKQPDDK